MFRLVFLSPESLFTDDRWRDMLQSAVYQKRLVGLVVDEAHCVVPNRPSIRYSVVQSPDNIEDAFAPLVEQLQREKTLMERILSHFKSKLWAEITEPIGAVDLAYYGSTQGG